MNMKRITQWPSVSMLVCTLLASMVATQQANATDPDWIVRGTHGMVATDSEYASQAGLEVLKAGGNAIDAAVAVSFALAVTRPESTGLGGGGFMIARLADGQIIVQDFRETAPSTASVNMYKMPDDVTAAIPPPSRFGYRAVAVPGLVAGRCQALTKWGTQPLGKLLKPAIKLAREGFQVDQHYVEATTSVLETYQQYPDLKKSCSYVYQTHLGSGQLRSVGDKLVQPKLARLIEKIANEGEAAFYGGPVAKALSGAMKSHNGIMSVKDLADYTVKMRKPIISKYHDYELILMPPSSSGGIALAETLNILEAAQLGLLFRADPVRAIHSQIEAMKHAFADRARWLGDTDFVDVPVSYLTSKEYGISLGHKINAYSASPLDTYGSETMPDDSGTSHFCIADAFGNVVVSTETINTSFGSLAAIDDWGLILNNEMDDFTAEVNKPNIFGLIQSKRNMIEPGKRPISSMSPTIVLKDGKPYLMLGASGGPRIISSVLNVLIAVIDIGSPLKSAIMMARPHHQWKPGRVYFDKEPIPELSDGLRIRKHLVDPTRKTGFVEVIQKTPDGWVGASDPRKGGKPAGY